jgi:hypothetical protein
VQEVASSRSAGANADTDGGGASRAGRRWWRAVLDGVIIAAGLTMLIWGIVALAHPAVSCRGVRMAPGDVCHKSSYTAERTDTVQTYEQRRRAVAQSRPTVIALGATMTAFGTVMVYRRFRQ